MRNCPHTKLTMPECSCNHCIERQLSDFAPERITVIRKDIVPLPVHGPRNRETPSVSERLTRPSL